MMKIKSVLVAIFSAISLFSTSAMAEVRIFEQPLDHFRANSDTFPERVEVIVPPGTPVDAPVLFFLGGESPRDLAILTKPFQSFLAKHPVILVAPEHRGYGISISKDEDQTTPSYVSAGQAIEDYHSVIQSLKSEFTGPWIGIGYSYSGGLAVHLAYSHPEDVQAVMSSSGVLTWSFSYTGYEKAVHEQFPSELYEKLSRHIQKLTPSKMFSPEWRTREYFQWAVAGSAQYQRFNEFRGYLDFISNFDTPIFSWFLHVMDSIVQAGGTEWWQGRVAPTLSREQALSQKYYSHYWGYQECHEMGTLISPTPEATSHIFVQTDEDWRDYCEKMYGERPTFTQIHDWQGEARSLSVPLFYIGGLKDPWFGLELDPSAKFASGGQYFVVPEGYHAPDRDDPALTTQVMEAVFGSLKLAP